MQNHFEVPPLFHLACIALYVLDGVGAVALAFAWAFFGLRLIHTVVHLNGNQVPRRFMVFGMSLIALLGLWGCLLLAVIRH